MLLQTPSAIIIATCHRVITIIHVHLSVIINESTASMSVLIESNLARTPRITKFSFNLLHSNQIPQPSWRILISHSAAAHGTTTWSSQLICWTTDGHFPRISAIIITTSFLLFGKVIVWVCHLPLFLLAVSQRAALPPVELSGTIAGHWS